MILTEYALKFLNVPYRWGGSNPLTGFDCSGFILELLKSAGMAPFEDGTAQALYNYFRNNGNTSGVGEGSLCFYGKTSMQITHVAYMISCNQIIEAASGDSTTTTLDRAKEQGACIKIRPYDHRKDLVEIIQPNYPRWVQNGTAHSL